jgi:hypothetical protein
MKLLKEQVEHDENFHGLVAVNSLETYVVRLSIKLLKELGSFLRVLPATLKVTLTASLRKSLMN